MLTPEDTLDPSALAALVAWVPQTMPGRGLYLGVEREHLLQPIQAPREAAPSLAEAPQFLRRALIRAVDVALVGVRRVAVMTGGGIDSAVLLGLAVRWAKRTGGSAFAISLDFEGSGDDRPHLRALEHHLNCEVVRIVPEDAAHRIALLRTGGDAAPLWHPMGPMEAEMVTRARAHGAERVLLGGGADELFGGSPQAVAEIAARGHPLRALRAAHRLSGFARPAVPAWSFVVRPLLGRLLPARVRGWRDRRAPLHVPPRWAGPVLRSFFEERRRLAGAHAVSPPRTASQRFAAIRDDPYRVSFACSRQQNELLGGVDIWWPYLDLELAAAVALLPPDYLLLGDRWRGLLRASIRDLVPDSLREREDKAFFEPALRRFIDAAGGLASMRPLASMRELASLGLVDPQAFAAEFERFVAAPEDGEAWASLWPPLAIEAFLQGRSN